MTYIFFSIADSDKKTFLVREYILRNSPQNFRKKTRECKRLVSALHSILSHNSAKNRVKKLTLKAKFGVTFKRCNFKIFLVRKNNISNDEKFFVKKRHMGCAYI